MKSISLGRFLDADFEFHTPRAVGEIEFWAYGAPPRPSRKGAPVDPLLIPRGDTAIAQ